jgi:hypothetical protein
VVVGSDVVWDCNLFGFDPVYFGALNAGRVIAYAASAGTYDPGPDVPKEVEKGLRGFDAVSVRDACTARLVERSTGQTPPRVLDPVFLPQNLDELDPVPGSMPPFLLVYGANFSPADVQVVRTMARNNGWRVVAVGRRHAWADQSIVHLDPRLIFDWFRAARFVVSCTFHGCVFALRMKVPFVVRIHGRVNNKVTDLLDVLQLRDLGAESLAELAGPLPMDLPWERITSVLDDLRNASLDFLKRELA